MSSKDLNNHNLNIVNSVDPILNLNDNRKEKDPKKENDNSNEQKEEQRYQKLYSKLKEIKYENIFGDKFIDDFIENDLDFFEKKLKEKNKEQKEQEKKENIYNIKKFYSKNNDNTEQRETENKEDSKEIDFVENNQQKEIKKEIREINDKFNLIKIYIDLKNLYEENLKENILKEDFRVFANSIIGNNKKDDIVKKFDILYQRIKVNLFGKKGNYFSILFFQNIQPKMLKFFNRFFMLRIYLAMKGEAKKIKKISIINKENLLNKEILSNIIIKMISIYKIFLNQPEEFSSKLISSINKGIYVKMKPNDEKGEKSDINKFIENEQEYLDVLLDYVYFYKTFLYDDKKKENKGENIYNKYTTYYDGLSIFKNNNNNYSYINEYRLKNIYDEDNKKWNKYIKEEYENEGLGILFNLLERMSNKRDQGIFCESKADFYEMIFTLLNKKMEEKEKNKENDEEEKNKENKENIKLINVIIKIILSDEENIFKNYLKYEEENKKGIFQPIINSIRENLIRFIENKEYANNDYEMEYLNSLIILLQSFGEYENKHLLEYIFEKYNNKLKSVFDILIDAYEKILIDLKDIKEFDEIKKNKLIIFHSLTNCINEYIALLNNKDKKNNSKINTNKIKEKKKDEKKGSTLIEDNETRINKIINNKYKNLKKDNFIKYIKNNNVLIYDIFIIENHLQLVSNLIKHFKEDNLNEENKLNYLIKKLNISNHHKHKKLFFESLILMNRCFKHFLNLQKISLNYEKVSDKIDYIEYDINLDDNDIDNIGSEMILNIKDDVTNLYDRYKTNNLNVFLPLEENGGNELIKYKIKKELLVLIFLNYKKIFYLINSDSFDLKEYEYFLYINDNDNNIRSVRNLIDYYFAHNKHRLIVLFSFLQKIHDIIEIKIDNQISCQLNLLKPEYLIISKNSKNYFSNLIDYTLPETKLMTIYNYVECITYDIKRKKWLNEDNKPLEHVFYPQRNWEFIDKLAINTYKFWEVINFLLFITINIILIIKYKKSRNEDEFVFNKIDNRQNFLVTKLWPIFHILILIIFLIYWSISRAKLEYFFAMTKYINEYFTEDKKLSMGEKAKLLKKEKADFLINDFFPETREVKIKNYFDKSNIFEILYNKVSYFYTIYIKVYIYTIKMVYPFIMSIICLCLTYWSQIFYIFPVFLVFNLSEILLTIFLLFIEQGTTLFIIAIFFIVILYIFSWIGFFFLPQLFKYEAVDKNNELVNLDYTEENICSSTVPCVLYFLNFGFRDDFMEQNLISFKSETGYYFRQFFFNIFLYIFIHLIFDNIFLVTISNAFDDMKKNMIKNNDKKENVCFICNLKKNDCIKEYKDFQKHLEKHNMWKYIRYICKILLKKRYQYTDEEYYVWKQIRDKKLEWFPRTEEQKEEGEEEEEEEDEEN